ncbi:TlpA family protein disulfide reductase [bacterium]|nr:MAG: TlpA family protein disulfide reductase [bacterium]
MDCAAHRRGAEWTCAVCARALCPDCGPARWRGALYCPECARAAEAAELRRAVWGLRLRQAGRWAAVLLAAAAVFGVVKGCDRLDRFLAQPKEAGLKPAPAFSATDIDGRVWSLEALRGKVVVLDFWATWCPPCRRLLPDLKRLNAEYKGRGVVVLGVNRDEELGELRKAVTELSLDWPQIHDPSHAGAELADLYGVRELPTTVIIDRRGRLYKRWGTMDRKMSTYLDALVEP